MLRTTPSLTTQRESIDEKVWCIVISEKDSTHDESCVDVDLDDHPTVQQISTSIDSPIADQRFETTPCHRARQEGSDPSIFTFRCRLRPFPATLISPSLPCDPLLSCATSMTASKPTSTDNKTTPISQPIQLTEAGPSISALQDSLVACSIEPMTRESYSTLSKRRFGFDTSLSNIQYGYGSKQPYRFTSPLSPVPRNRKRSKIRRHKNKPAPSNTLLQKTLRRNHAEALRKRYPLRPISPPNYDSLPSLDEDDEDEFDDDEDDEIIDDFDADGDAQVDDIVDLYNQRSPEQEVSPKYSCIRGSQEPVSTVSVAEDLIHISSNMMTNPSGLEPVSLKPVLEETGAFVLVAQGSDY